MKQKQYCKATQDWLYGLNKNEVFECIGIYFRNGEHHAVVKDESGVVKEYPSIFLVECDEYGVVHETEEYWHEDM